MIFLLECCKVVSKPLISRRIEFSYVIMVEGTRWKTIDEQLRKQDNRMEEVIDNAAQDRKELEKNRGIQLKIERLNFSPF